MANGIYYTADTDVDDCWADVSTFNNSSEYLVVGNYSGSIRRSYIRYLLDLPQGAYIDHAYWHYYCYIVTASTIPDIYMEDVDTAAEYSSNPFGRSLSGFAPLVTSGNAKRYLSTDCKDVLQSIINRVGWASGNYLGFVLAKDGAAGYWQSFQNNYTPFMNALVVDYHTAEHNIKTFAPTSDTYAYSNDVTDRNSESTMLSGRSAGGHYIRSFIRYNIDIPQGAIITNAYLTCNNLAGATIGKYLQVGTLSNTSDWAVGSSNYNRGDTAEFIDSGHLINWNLSAAWGNMSLHSSDDIAIPIQDAINIPSYSPNNYITLCINEGNMDSGTYRTFCSLDAGIGYQPIYLTVKWQNPLPIKQIYYM